MEGLHTVTSLPQSVIQCGLCKETITKPRVLPCLHSFCHGCLRDYIDGQSNGSNGKYEKRGRLNIVTCPECPVHISLQSGTELIPEVKGTDAFVQCFPENTFLERMVTTVWSLNKENKNCDICLRIGRCADAAVNWCCDCYEALCESCSGVHQGTGVTSEHDVISIAQARQKPLALLLNKERDVSCKHHQGEILKLFCQSCSVTLCAQCVTGEHKLCGKCVTIGDAYTNHEDELDALCGKLETVHRFVTEAKNVLTEERESFDDRVEKIREEIQAMSRNLCQRIQESEEKLLAELDRWRLETEPEINLGITKMIEYGNQVQKTREIVETLLHYGCEAEIMTSLNSIRDQTAQTETSAYQNVATCNKRPDISFSQSKVTADFAADFETLGEIRYNEGVSDNSCDQLSTWGIACVSRDDMIVVDGTNKALHKFRRGGSLIDQIAFSDEPRDVTHMGQGDIAVTMNRKQVMFLGTTGKLKLKQTVKTQKSYHGISALACDKLVVSYLGSGKSVDIISLEGVIERTLSMDEHGAPLFFDPRYLATTKGDTQLILVSDFRKQSIICLNSDGQVKFKFQSTNGHRTLKPLGICSDRFGNIFVADYSRDEIALLSKDGKYQRSVVTREDEMDRPVAVDISRDGRLVIVQNDGMVRVFSY
ncbi:tripartite motif-containing protein 2-like [Liolophura sinensis]|uniref:tripartite motif-containing protein 2-like n=1 Tax=Liolophura sinensis TaxID=3198878 RepID=UPI003158D662